MSHGGTLTRMLLREGADALVVTAKGETLLHLARPACVGLAKMLVDEGIDVNATDANGRTAMHVALTANDAFAVRELKRAGATVPPAIEHTVAMTCQGPFMACADDFIKLSTFA